MHPRFAVGESSTPLADFLLERISQRFQIPELYPLSRWGSWQRTLPQLRAGKKRGFSYYYHQAGKPFDDGALHDRSLLVAASASDEVSDTHWMRCDVDQWLFEQAGQAGVQRLENAEVRQLSRHASTWNLECVVDAHPIAIAGAQLIDASGGALFPMLKQALAGNDQASIEDQSGLMFTRTASVFGHFCGVSSMTAWMRDHGFDVDQDPFDGDDAAQHHWLEAGWMWMLRFSEGTCSVGLTLPCDRMPAEFGDAGRRGAQWTRYLQQFPTVYELLGGAELIGPISAKGMPQLAWIPRISRLRAPAAGEGWLSLPSSVGLIDPLHSTGIAHSLYGVLRAAEMLLTAQSESEADRLRCQYASERVEEIRWIDRLVYLCYLAGEWNFDALVAASCFYFVGAIHSERQLANIDALPEGFLLCRSSQLQLILDEAIRRVLDLRATKTADPFVRWVREQIAPWNNVGLLDERLHNRIARSNAPK